MKSDGVSPDRGKRAEAAAPETSERGERLSYYFVKGILVNLSNPKSTSPTRSRSSTSRASLPRSSPADASALLRLAAILIVVGESVIWHSLLAFLFSRNEPRRLYARLGGWIERTVGGIFVLIGARLLWAAMR
jgi:threonine efflux protein